MNNEELIPLVITAAVASSGPVKDSRDWSDTVLLNITRIGTMMNDGSREWKLASQMLEAPVFVAKYVSHTVEETSTRCLVMLDSGRPSRNYPDGVEPIRSERTDGALGQSMKARLERLEPGDEILVWKGIDELPSGDKARVLLNFRFLRRAGNTQERTARPAETPPPEGVPDDVPTPTAAADDPIAFAHDRFNELDSRSKAQVARRARDENIIIPTPSDPDQAERLLWIIGDVTGT